MASTLSPLLLDLLVCPEDHGPLYFVSDEDLLYNPRLMRTYAVVDGIPNLLIDDATALDAAANDRLGARVAEDAIPATGSGPMKD